MNIYGLLIDSNINILFSIFLLSLFIVFIMIPIIVADHGAVVDCFEDEMLFGDRKASENATYFNPILLVKDFSETGELKIDYSFTTNADTPIIAFDV